MDNNWLLAVLTLLKARMNLHWCFLAVILNNIFLWLKLLSVIVSRYFCDSQSSGACRMYPSLASPTLSDWCTWDSHVCICCLSRLDLYNFSGTTIFFFFFMRNSLSKKHLNSLIKCLGSGLWTQTASNYPLDVWSGQVI